MRQAQSPKEMTKFIIYLFQKRKKYLLTFSLGTLTEYVFIFFRIAYFLRWNFLFLLNGILLNIIKHIK